MIAVVLSPMGVPIRLTVERWAHIIDDHPELADLQHGVLDTVKHPERVMAGRAGELLAIREHELNKWFVVAYRELNGDGFIITAFITSRIIPWLRRGQVWP